MPLLTQCVAVSVVAIVVIDVVVVAVAVAVVVVVVVVYLVSENFSNELCLTHGRVLGGCDVVRFLGRGYQVLVSNNLQKKYM